MIEIFGGGTVSYVRNHLALCTPAYGSTARALARLFLENGVPAAQVRLNLTRMADPQGATLETNEDVAERLNQVLDNPSTRVIIFNVALCDYRGQIGEVPSGKYAERLSSREGAVTMALTPQDKLLARVCQRRPDVLLVGFKTTAGATEARQLDLAHRQFQETGAQLVLANDTLTRHNLLVHNEGGTTDYICHKSANRAAIIRLLAEEVMQHLGVSEDV